MSTATLNPKKSKATAERPIAPELVVLQRFVCDSQFQPEADAINAEGADITEDAAELESRRARHLASSSWELSLRELVDASGQFHADRAVLNERILDCHRRRQAFLPSLMPGANRNKTTTADDKEKLLDDLEAAYRTRGIDELSFPGGEYVRANAEASRERFRTWIATNDPKALEAQGHVNRAKETCDVLKSMLPIPTTQNMAYRFFKWKPVATDLPAFIVNLFT